MPAGKTPGEVAYEAHALALVKETGIGTNAFWDSLPEHEVKVWEAAAQAMRKQAGEEIQASEGKPAAIITQAVMDMAAVTNLKKDLAWWDAQDWGSDYHHSLEQLIIAVEPFLPDEPKPESAAACAEDAGAERSKSPPPAER